MGPIFTTADIAHIRKKIPKFEFDSVINSEWCAGAPVQAYLHFYQIDFTQRYPGLQYHMGYVDCAGFRTALQVWQPQEARGTLVLIHGYYDHVGIYGKAIAYGLAQGLAVVAFDLPGHGLSSGERIAIDNFDQYADVLAGVLSVVRSDSNLPQPFFGLGQSTGGSVWLNYLWRYQAPVATASLSDKYIARIVLCAPLVLPRGWKLGRYLYWLVKPFIKRMPRGPSLSSHDLAFNDFVDYQDPLQSHYLSVRWVGAMKAWNEQFCGFTPRDEELLFIQGTADLTVDWQYNLPLIQAKLPALRVEMIEGSGHQLVNESEAYRSAVFSKVTQFLFNE